MDRSATDDTERLIAEAVVGASGFTVSRLGLRFDRVVVRVLGRLRLFVDAEAPEGLTVVLTLTAPIRVPGKTVAALRGEIAALAQAGGVESERSVELHGNQAKLRIVKHVTKRSHRLLGFVRNADVDAAQLLDLAELWLRSTGSVPRATHAAGDSART